MIKTFSSSTENKITQIKAVIIDWSLAATFHCYPKLFQPHAGTKAKFIWLFVLLSFLSLTVWFMSKAMIEFFQYETVSKIEIITQNPSAFPTITICSSSPFTTKIAELLYENISIKYNISSLSALPLVRLIVASNKYYNDTQRQALGFNLTESLVVCAFNTKSCNVSDFHYLYNYMYGNCFQFNHEMNKTSRLPGKTYGLNLMIGPLYNSNRNAISFSDGLVMFIHNKTNPPSLFEDPILLETGKEIDVAVRRTCTQNSPRPFGECTDELFGSELARSFQYANQTYTQKHCLDLCLQKLIIDECKCYMSTLVSLNSSQLPCLTLIDYECVEKQFYNYIDKKLDYCNDLCLLECESTSFEISMSSLAFPTQSFFEDSFNFLESVSSIAKTYEKTTNKTFKYETLKDRYLYFNIFYPSLKYTQITESPKTSLIELISNMGGLLGIFLGLSIFSLIEIVEIVVKIIGIYLGYFKY